MTKRITNHPLLEDVETETVEIYFNNKPLECNINDSVASCLLANGIRTVRHHEQDGSPRGIFCNIGHCFECRADINGIKGVRTCLTQVKDGMTVVSGQQLPHDVKEWSDRHV